MIERIQAKNFRRFESIDLTFDGTAQLILIEGSNGAGKCLPGSAKVADADAGTTVTLAEFVARRLRRTYGYHQGRITAVDVDEWHENGIKPIVRIECADGRTLRAAYTHPILTASGIRAAGDVRKGDLLATAREDAAGPAHGLVHVAVVDATYDGEEECFDISVATDEHLYVADGFVVHNSTVLEAIHFALWGEGRHGRRNLDNLTRRGAEIEGMSVELEFTVGDDRYRVHRRRDGRSSTAVLYCNGDPLVEGAGEVTAEIENVLGMDAAGFRVAVTAHQKDLDGLASLRPAERARMVGRLMNLDVLEAAKTAAAEAARRDRAVAAGLADEATARLQQEIGTTTAGKQAVDAEAAEAEAEVSRLATVVADTAAAAAAHRERTTAWRIADAAVTAARARVENLRERQRDTAGVDPEADAAAEPDLPALRAAADEARVAHARAEAAAEKARYLADVAEELTAAEAALERSARIAAEPRTRPAAEKAAAAAEKAEKAAAGKAVSAAEDAAAARARAQASADACSAAGGELGSVCGRCGQEVDADAHARHLAELEKAASAAAEEAAAAEAARTAAEEAHRTARKASEEARKLLAAAADHDRQVGAAEAEAENLRIRVSSYRRQLDGHTGAGAEAKDTAAAVEAATAAVAAAEELMDRKIRSAAAARTRRAVEAELAVAEKDLADTTAAADAAAPDADGAGSEEAHQQALAAREAETQLLHHLRQESARLDERLRQLTEQQQQAVARAERQQEHQAAAVAAAAAVRLLAATGSRVAASIRPELEGAVSTLLEQMSEGRFTRVALGDDYGVTVEDDGKLRDVTELSGGEGDLVALALRLALAQVFTARSGSAGAGFLILDECFGSQDPARRRAVLEALRGLRSVYQQILIISHVENLEDAADVVLRVERDGDASEVEER